VPQFEQGRALLIGLSEYTQADLEQVPLTSNETKAIGAALQDKNVAGYAQERVRVLAPEETTRDKMVAALEKLAAETKPTDTVFVYLASHGDLGTDTKYYFATRDVELTPTRQIVPDSGLSAERLRELFQTIQAQKLLVIINTCFSGEVTGTLSTKGGSMPSTTFNYQNLATGEGRAIITASRGTQPSFFPKNGEPYTYFGRAVLDALNGKGIPSTSGYIGLFELYSAVYDNVTDTLKGTQYKQEPTLTLSNAFGRFPLALNQGGKIGGLNVSLLDDKLPTGRAVDAVDDKVIQNIKASFTQTTVTTTTVGGNQVNAGGAGSTAIGGSLVSLEGATIHGSVTFGDVAAGDIPKTYNISNVAGSTDQAQILKAIGDLRADLAKANDLPDDARDDANDALEAAEKAGKENKKERMLEKLDVAQKVMLKLAATVPVAVKVGETIGTLLQRAMGLWT
jgi:hypothetical protein